MKFTVFKKAILVAGLLAAASSYAGVFGGPTRITLGYSTDKVDWRPVKISNLQPASTYYVSLQQPGTSLASLVSLNWGWSFAHYNMGHDKSAWSVTMYPELRFWLYHDGMVKPTAVFSIGPGYISDSHLGGAKLGSRFIFQSYAGLGVEVGQKHIFTFMLRYMHYTNFGIFKNNDGFDVPLMFTVGYQF